MNIDFFTSVSKTSGTQFKPAGASATPVPGFREQLTRVMRDNDRKNESALEKKSVWQKKPAAAEKPARDTAEAGEKPAAAGKSVRTDKKYAENETVEAEISTRPDQVKDTSETDTPKFALGSEESGFYGELIEAETSSETENDYAFTAPQLSEASDTENDYTFILDPAETPVPAEFSDFSVSSSADAQIFPPVSIEDDSGFAEMVNLKAVLENAASIAGLNTTRQGSVNATPDAGADAASQTAAGKSDEEPTQEAANASTQQNASFSDGDEESIAKESFKADADNVELKDAESARSDIKDILGNTAFQKNLESAQYSNRNNVSLSRNEESRNELLQEYKFQSEIEESELSKQFAVRAAFEKEDALLERMTAQTIKPRGVSTFADAAENVVKTVQGAAEGSVQAASGAAKAEASVPARNVPVPDQDFVVELAGRIQAQIRGGREMIRIQLHPEELGKLEIRAESGRDGIVARIAAESVNVKKLLESNIQNLQQTLESRGLKVDRLHIVVEEATDTALVADGGRYDNSGARARNEEVDEFTGFNDAAAESQQDEAPLDLSAVAEQRGVGFYTVA